MPISVVTKSYRSIAVTAGGSFTVSSNGTVSGNLYLLSIMQNNALSANPSTGEGVTWTFVAVVTGPDTGSYRTRLFRGVCTSAGTGNWTYSAGTFAAANYILEEVSGADQTTPIVSAVVACANRAATSANVTAELGTFATTLNIPYALIVTDSPTTQISAEPGFTTILDWVTSSTFSPHISTIFNTSADNDVVVNVSGGLGSGYVGMIALEIAAAITTINVQSSDYGYEVGSLSLVQQHAISPASSEYGFDILSVNVFGAVIVVPSDYGYESGSPSLVQQHIIAPASSEYGYESQSAEVLRNIAVQSLEMGYEIGSVEFVRNLIVQSSEYGIEIESVDLVQQHAISPGSSEYGYETGSLSLVQQQEISPASSEYGFDIGTVNFAIIYTLGVESAEFGYETKSVLLRMFRPGGSLGRRIIVPQDKRRILI